jgi:hypothetical protein
MLSILVAAGKKKEEKQWTGLCSRDPMLLLSSVRAG